jgi:streptogramin lyase
MFSAPGASNNPLGSGGSGIAAGEDGLWYVAGLSAIRRVSTDGQFTSYPIPASAGLTDHPGQFQFRGITTGADGAIWFIAANEIGHLV